MDVHYLDRGHITADAAYMLDSSAMATVDAPSPDHDLVECPVFNLLIEHPEGTVLWDTGAHPDAGDGYWPAPRRRRKGHRLPQVGLRPGVELARRLAGPRAPTAVRRPRSPAPAPPHARTPRPVPGPGGPGHRRWRRSLPAQNYEQGVPMATSLLDSIEDWRESRRRVRELARKTGADVFCGHDARDEERLRKRF